MIYNYKKYLGSRLKEKNMLEAGTTICSYRQRECNFTKFFDQHNDLVSVLHRYMWVNE